jgi:competence protein ComEC
MEVDLTGVELAESFAPLVGGLRLGCTPREGDKALPEVHAGDDVVFLAQARLPLLYRDQGAFDRREFLAQQNIYLLATLRASALLERTGTSPATVATRVALLRARLRQQLDSLFPSSPVVAGILRAMLLGDRSFIDWADSVDYQKTGVFHVLVVAGLHVGALAFFLFGLVRLLRLPRGLGAFLIFLALFAYVAMVEQRAPVLRAGLMTLFVLLGTFCYRRLELMNQAALAALVLLVANPKAISDTSFQLSFLAIGCIAGMALPLIRRYLQPHIHALGGWRDVTRDASFAPALV